MIGSISDAAFSFIVQEPSGIIDVSRPMSLRSRLADVAHHLRFGVMRVEDRMRQERRRAREARRDTPARARPATRSTRGAGVPRAGREHRHDARRCRRVDGLVERDVDRAVVAIAEVDARGVSAALANAVDRARRHFEAQRVEVRRR